MTINADQRTQNTILDRLNIPGNNPNQRIQHVSKTLKEGTCPVIVRKLIEAENAHQTNNGENVRTAACVATCCTPLNIAEKILRVALWTFCLPCGLVISSARERKYGLQDEVKQSVKRVGEEWIDCVAASSVICAGPTLMCCPSSEAAENYTTNMVEKYYPRAVERSEKDQRREDMIEAYDHWQKLVKKAFDEGSEIPDQQEIMTIYLNDKNRNREPFSRKNLYRESVKGEEEEALIK